MNIIVLYFTLFLYIFVWRLDGEDFSRECDIFLIVVQYLKYNIVATHCSVQPTRFSSILSARMSDQKFWQKNDFVQSNLWCNSHAARRLINVLSVCSTTNTDREFYVNTKQCTYQLNIVGSKRFDKTHIVILLAYLIKCVEFVLTSHGHDMSTYTWFYFVD